MIQFLPPSWRTPPLSLLFYVPLLLSYFGLGSLLAPVGMARGTRLFVSGILGITIAHILVISFMPLWLTVGLVLAGGAWAFVQRPGLRWSLRATGLLVLSLWFVFMVFAEDLIGNDGLWIWFAHGRAIFEAGGMYGVDWNAPVHIYAHTDYPKLMGALSAQAAWTTGFWDCRWPKIAILPLLALTQIGFYALPYGNRQVWFANFACLFGIGYLLWNGYMDGYLALAAFLSTGFLSAYLQFPRKDWLWSGLASVGWIAQMKNEGRVLALCFLVCLLFFTRKNRTQWRDVLREPASWLLLFVVLQWAFICWYFEIHNDMAKGFTPSLYFSRVIDPGFWSTFGHFVFKRGMVAPVLLVLLLIVRRGQRAVWFPLGVFALYSLFIVSAYLGTFWDVRDHLQSSFWRVILPLYCILFAAFFNARKQAIH